MSASVSITRTLSVPAWDGKPLGEALEYWMARGFEDISLHSDGVIRGVRGSWRMAWASGFLEGIDSDWDDLGEESLPTMLEMEAEDDRTVRVQLMVQTLPFRRSGEWDAALLRMEVIELQYLLHDAEMAAGVRDRFNTAARQLSKASGFFARRLPAELEAEVSDLEVRFLFTP